MYINIFLLNNIYWFVLSWCKIKQILFVEGIRNLSFLISFNYFYTSVNFIGNCTLHSQFIEIAFSICWKIHDIWLELKSHKHWQKTKSMICFIAKKYLFDQLHSWVLFPTVNSISRSCRKVSSISLYLPHYLLYWTLNLLTSRHQPLMAFQMIMAPFWYCDARRLTNNIHTIFLYTLSSIAFIN